MAQFPSIGEMYTDTPGFQLSIRSFATICLFEFIYNFNKIRIETVYFSNDYIQLSDLIFVNFYKKYFSHFIWVIQGISAEIFYLILNENRDLLDGIYKSRAGSYNKMFDTTPHTSHHICIYIEREKEREDIYIYIYI